MDVGRKIRAGDHIWVKRRGYEHHGLAVGPHRVIHYSGKDVIAGTGVIEEVPILTFAKGRVVRVIDHPERLHSRRESVRRARERIGEEKYNLLYNNCEHFVTWCIEDEQTSKQVNSAVRKAGFVATQVSMYRVYKTWTSKQTIAKPIASAATQLSNVSRATSTAFQSAHAARTATTLAPALRAALGTSSSKTAASLAVAKGLSAVGLTKGLVGTAATTAGIISAPASVPAMAVALTFGLTVTAVSAVWDQIFD